MAPSRRASKQAAEQESLGRHIVVTGFLLLVLAAATTYLLLDMSGGEGAAAAGDVANDGETAAVPPPVIFEPAVVNFGEMLLNTTQTKTARVVNTGTTPLRIVTGRASCGCTRVEVPPARIEPGGSQTITLHMDSESRPGERTVTANIFFAGYDEPAALLVRRIAVE